MDTVRASAWLTGYRASKTVGHLAMAVWSDGANAFFNTSILFSARATESALPPDAAGLTRRRVRFGSLAAAARSNEDVRFTPKSCRSCHRRARQLRAISGH